MLAPSALRGERKLVTVLFADVVRGNFQLYTLVFTGDSLRFLMRRLGAGEAFSPAVSARVPVTSAPGSAAVTAAARVNGERPMPPG